MNITDNTVEEGHESLRCSVSHAVAEAARSYDALRMELAGLQGDSSGKPSNEPSNK